MGGWQSPGKVRWINISTLALIGALEIEEQVSACSF